MTITGLWFLAVALDIIAVLSKDFYSFPQHSLYIPKESSSGFLFSSFITGLLVISVCIIAGTCVYLHYKIIYLNWFSQSVKRTVADERKAVKVGRLVEILQEQVKPMFTVFIAGRIDALFNVLTIFLFILGRMVDWELYMYDFSVVPSQLCLHFSHAVVYALHDNAIWREILEVYKNILGPKKSKVIMLNGQ